MCTMRISMVLNLNTKPLMTTLESPRFLLVDDNENDFLLVKKKLLAKWPDAKLQHAIDETSLIEQLSTFHADLVICDYSMPVLTHHKVLELVKAQCPTTPLILLSGHTTEVIGVDFIREGVRDYVEKSKPDRLIPAIERELHTVSLEREKAKLEKAHLRAVFFDNVTGFLNRQGFQRTLNDFIQMNPERKDLCIVTVGLSRQTRRTVALNQTQQKTLVTHIHNRLRHLFVRDIVCQWSDNLIVILMDQFDWSLTNEEVTLERLSRIELELERPVMMDSFPVRPHFKLGLARPMLDGVKAEELVRHARSVALTLSAQSAPLTTSAQPHIHEMARRRQTIAADLGQGIENNQLQLQYQPVQCLRTGQVVAIEALVRWKHDTLGMIMPDEFIGVAEDSGLINALGNWVVQQTCQTIKKLHAKGHMLCCAINCSTIQLLDSHFANEMKRMISDAGVDPKYIEFEITETAAIDDMKRTISAVERLKNNGTKVVLDDFGTGYSSLNYLRQLPVEVLKIDKSFIKDLLENQSSHMIVKAVIDLAHALGLTVHAEGIERQEQKELLHELGCDRLQGFLLGRPMFLDVLENWLVDRLHPDC